MTNQGGPPTNSRETPANEGGARQPTRRSLAGLSVVLVIALSLVAFATLAVNVGGNLLAGNNSQVLPADSIQGGVLGEFQERQAPADYSNSGGVPAEVISVTFDSAGKPTGQTVRTDEPRFAPSKAEN